MCSSTYFFDFKEKRAAARDPVTAQSPMRKLTDEDEDE
jgi:hypothetical protein